MQRRIGLAFLALIGIVALLAIVEYLPIPASTYLWDRVFDTGHILVFGVCVIFMLLFTQVILGAKWLHWQYASCMLLASVLGLAVELWQRDHGRDAEWIDLYSDVVGVVAFAAIYAFFDSRPSTPRSGLWKRGWLALFAVGVLILGLLPLVPDLNLYIARRNVLPRLIDFEQPWEGKLYYVRDSTLTIEPPPDAWTQSESELVGKMNIQPGAYPGFVMIDAYPDWSGYEYFEWEVLLDDTTPQAAIIRAHDLYHDVYDYRDRFRREFDLQPGFQRIRVDIADMKKVANGRELELDQMHGFSLFFPDLDRPLKVYVGEARLFK